jgi:ribonucleotide monophosphatase NagD (HAD superfamily)
MTSFPGKHVFFVTNNSTKSRSSFLKKFEGFGIKASVVSVFKFDLLQQIAYGNE